MREYLDKYQKRGKICFITANAIPLLSGKPTQRIIGPDVYTSILAKAMKDKEYQVSLITYWDEDPQIEIINDITIFKIKSCYNRIKILDRFFKLVALWRYVTFVKADYYFHAGGMDGACSFLCKILGKKYVYSIGSDAQLNRQLISISNHDFSKSMLNIGTLGCSIDILLADLHIVQSEYQKRLLKEKFNKTGIIIKMPFPITKKENFEKSAIPTAIWVGSLAKVKQPELFVQIAERIPNANFIMIGGNSEGYDILNYITEQEIMLPNFKYVGVVPFNNIDKYFERANLLVNTSLFEGFPNAFIQSWMHCTPVVSLNADPDEIICNLKLGFHSMSVEQMIVDIQKMLQDKDLCKKMGQNGRIYVENNHNIESIAQNYEAIFNCV